MNKSRRPLIAGNWKMHHGGPSSCDLAAAIAAGAAAHDSVDVLVLPPYTAIAAVAAELDGSHVEVGAQNVYPKEVGAFTGEISGSMLSQAGAQWVLAGHSERRHLFNESDAFVADKAEAALSHGLKPILCVGETLAERDAGRTLEVVLRQLEAALSSIERGAGKAAIAYEPVWAIGTGRNATAEQANEVHAAIRARLAAESASLAETTRILYGGSVKADNAVALLSSPDVDGALVGGASLDANQFLAIVQAAARLALAR